VRRSSIDVSIRGPRAEAATRDLFSKGWFEAEWEQRPERQGEEEQRPPSSVVHAQVLAIGGGSVTIADNLLGWWEGWRESEPSVATPLEVVLEGPTGSRVSLGTTDRDGLVDVLRVLHWPAR
jgi:hypothetical protein